MKKISIVSGCFNEEENLLDLYSQVNKTIKHLREKYLFEFIIIDNDSQDKSREILIELAKKDKDLKLIFNNRNFGHIRSPYWAIMQSSGDATIYLASDLQDPPELIPEFIKAWERGNSVVMATKPNSKTNQFFHFLRKKYYSVLNKISDVELTSNTTGFGLYDQSIVDQVKEIKDPYPYLRGLINELGYKIYEIDFIQPKRDKGESKNNLYTLYDIGMLGIVSHSKVPIRTASFLGLFLGATSIVAAIGLVVLKILNWDEYSAGLATIGVLLLFFIGMVLIFIGLLGEYILSIHTYVKNRPIVVEKERINFDEKN